MLDFASIRVWLMIGIAVVAFMPLRYVIRHIAHDPDRREITRPPEDLGWRSSGQFYRSVALLAGLAALAVFIFTPAAANFTRRDGSGQRWGSCSARSQALLQCSVS